MPTKSKQYKDAKLHMKEAEHTLAKLVESNSSLDVLCKKSNKTIPGKKLVIPTDLLLYVAQNDLYRPFQLYIYLKWNSSGKLKNNSEVFEGLKKLKNFGDERTIQKHIQRLLALNWIGHKGSTYFIRSFESLQRQHKLFERSSATFSYEYMDNFKGFVVGAILGREINTIKFRYKVAMPRKLNTALKSKEGARTRQRYSYGEEPPEYFGISLRKIATILKCSQTKACELKALAEEGGYIKANEKLQVVPEYRRLVRNLYTPNRTMKVSIEECFPDLKGKLVFRRVKKRFLLYQQLHDEIVPLLKFKSRRKISGKNLEVQKK